MMGRLADVLERMWEGQPRRRMEQFKTPSYDGQGDVEYFIRQFREVTEANEWNAAATLLHLREALREGAYDCGRVETVEEVFVALRARFGLSMREAKSKLAHLRKGGSITLQEHAMEVERLVNVAHADLPLANRTTMTLDAFCQSLGNTYLQRHLLAVQPLTLGDAVRAGNEYLQIRLPHERGSGTAVRNVDEEEMPTVSAVAGPTTETILQGLAQAMHAMMESIQKLGEAGAGSQREKKEQRKLLCWGCGQEGHTRRNCPTHPWKAGDKPPPASGNGARPQQ